MLRELTLARGVSGCEDEVRRLILKNITADSVTVDAMGNIIAFKKGKKGGKKVMCAAHMDEVGLIIHSITKDGFLKFKTVGGIDTRVLASKKVLIGDSSVPGIIAVRAVHMQTKEELKTALKEKDMYIDIGAKDENSAKALVSIGDYASFDSDYVEFGDGRVKAKALDDRVGCAVLIDLLKESFDFDFYAVFTVQEEVGLRGAKTAAFAVMPDAALVLEGTTASDVYGAQKHQAVTTLGGGVAIPVRDRTMVADTTLSNLARRTAEENNIPWQHKCALAGGTDAGAIHLTGAGIPCTVMAVPVRYLHSPTTVMDKADFFALQSLATLFLHKLEEEL